MALSTREQLLAISWVSEEIALNSIIKRLPNDVKEPIIEARAKVTNALIKNFTVSELREVDAFRAALDKAAV